MQQCTKLIVSPTPTCYKILDWIKTNIDTIIAARIYLKIVYISDSRMDSVMADELQKKGIARLPAAITPNGKILIGIEKIRGYLGQSMRRQSISSTLDNDDDVGLQDIWQRELFAGRDAKTGALIPRKDTDEAEDQGIDIQRKMDNYAQNVPAHRGGNGARRAPAPTRGNDRRTAPAEMDDPPEYDDDYDDYETPPPRQQGNTGGGNGGDDMDDRMMAAWMENH